MPTPVAVARQCLADEAAAVLDDAVAVAKRRCHAQTTSLHTVSALLALPSSILREASTRARSNAYAPRLQFRALELSVGVALDRLPVSKSGDDPPPVSNSLMAAIKRSQANQRRHPETFHLYQQQQLNSNSTISVVKVELKHFVLSILDDPIVSRVFGDAGFRTNEMKLAILSPRTMSRFSTTAYRPPLFFCSVNDFELNKHSPNFPFPDPAAVEKVDYNSRRIGEILLNRRSPLLVGACAGDALKNFIDDLRRGETGAFPKEIEGLSVVSMEHDISEVTTGGLSEEMMGVKFKHVDEMVDAGQGPGVLVNFGDLKLLVDVESVDADAASFIVYKLKDLLFNSGGKLRLIGFLAGDDVYKKLLDQFPSIEKDWDLNLLPITSSSIRGKCFKSSLMRSFVPFGGLFPMPSELESLCTGAAQSSNLCNSCHEKYEEEVSLVLKGASADTHKQSVNLSSLVQIADCETSKRFHTIEAEQDKTVLDVRATALRRKWTNICQRHCSWTSHEDSSLAQSRTTSVPSFQNFPSSKDTSAISSQLNGSRVSNLSPCSLPSHMQKNYLPKQHNPEPVPLGSGVTPQAETRGLDLDMNYPGSPSSSQQILNQPSVSVATDLRLGTTYPLAEESRGRPNFPENDNGVQNSELSRNHEILTHKVSQSSSWSNRLERHLVTKDLEQPWKVLAEKFCWQNEAIQTVNRTVSRCTKGDGRYNFSNKGNIWLSFLGPDRVGKRKLAAGVAEIVFGGKNHLLCFDLSSQDVISPFNSVIDFYCSNQKMMSGRKTIVDYLAEELKKHPDSVVLLENIEKADFWVRNSLSLAVKTGKFQDSHGRDISIKNHIFVLASSVLKGREDLLSGKVTSEFSEETILKAKNLQMQILVELVSKNSGSQSSTSCVSVHPRNVTSSQCPLSKRKLDTNESTRVEMVKHTCRSSRSIIDLNLPVEDMEEDRNANISDNDGEIEDSQQWFEELLEQFDDNVVFRPFDFDSLSRKILKEIDARLRKVVGAPILLEVDREVMVQLLAAAWLTDTENALENWIEQVLCSSIAETRKRCNYTADFVMKLVPRDGLPVEAQASGVCLPARINVN